MTVSLPFPVFIISIILLHIEVDGVSSNADFSQITSSKYFVDKTLLIQDLFVDEPDETGVKLITAPTGYGKSTVVDMVKRFVSLSTDNDGKVISPSVSASYKLFCDNWLNICQDRTFIRLHLGQYPVIHVDLAPLKGLFSFGSMLERFRTVLRTSFVQHSYLVENASLWLDDLEKEAFTRYYHDEYHKKLTEHDILYGFDVLSDLLFRQFGKGVFVLIDEFDAYENSLLFQNILHTEKVRDFYRKLHRNVLQTNQFLIRALVTGMHREAEISMAPNNVDEYFFLKNHKFCKYYGFSEREIEHLIKKNVANEKTQNDVRNLIESKCEGYLNERINRKIYSITTIIDFFKLNVDD